MNRRSFLSSASAAIVAVTNLEASLLNSAFAAPKVRRMLWAANVRNKSLDERLAAAQIGEFDAMSVFPIDYKSWVEGGLSGIQIRRKFEDAGVHASIVDPYVQWTPNFSIPADYPAENVAFINHTEDEVFAMAEALGANQMNLVEGLGQSHERNALVDALGEFAERADRQGLKLGLEPMPISTIATLDQGWDLVKTINRDNLGITFDTWHFWRSAPDHDVLRSIPGNKIFDVQLADAKTELQGSLIEDLLGYRLFPGEGDFDLDTTIAVLKEIGAFNSVGHELFSNAMDALPAEEVARLSAENLRRFL